MGAKLMDVGPNLYSTDHGSGGDENAIRMSCLLLDDDPIDTRYVSWLLQQANGYQMQISTASTLKEARRICANRDFDLYLFDYWMGEESSVSLLRDLDMNSRTPKTIVVMSSLDDETFQVSSLESGADFFLAKQNLTKQTLESMLRNVIHVASKTQTGNQQKLDDEKRIIEWMRFLRTELDTIHGFSTLALTSLEGNVTNDAKLHLKDALSHLSNVRNETTYLSVGLSAVHNHSQVSLRPFDVSQLIADIVGSCSLEAEQSGKTLSYCEHIADSIILSDPDLLEDLLTIVLRGAVRHGVDTKDIAVSYELSPMYVDIFISEFGDPDGKEVEKYQYGGSGALQLADLFGKERTGSFLVAEHILQLLKGSWSMGNRDRNTEIVLRIPLNIDSLN